MRIFFASIGWVNSDGTPGLWAKNLCDPLVRLGHSVERSAINWDLSPLAIEDGQRRRARLSERLVAEVRRAHQRKPLDLFLSYFYSVHVEPEAIRQIRKLGVPTINFYCNADHQFHLVSEIAPAYDFCWVPERRAVSYYKGVGATPIHVQLGANPAFYRPVPGVKRDISAVFIGQLYADRARWLARLIARGVDVRIHTQAFVEGNGKGTPEVRRSLSREAIQDLRNYGVSYLRRRFIRMVTTRRALSQIRTAVRPPPSDDEMLGLFARSHTILNFCHVYDGGLPGGRVKTQVRLRDFEAPMCRGLYMPQYYEELALYYDIEREVVAWNSLGELVERIGYYLAHPDDAERVREAGYRRAVRDHTWEKRYKQLFRAVGLLL